jgi:hypothetical protein
MLWRIFSWDNRALNKISLDAALMTANSKAIGNWDGFEC